MITPIASNIIPKQNTKNKISMTGLTTNLLKTEAPPKAEKTLLNLCEDVSSFVRKLANKAFNKKNRPSVQIVKDWKLVEMRNYHAESGKLKEKIIYNPDGTRIETTHDKKGKIKTLLAYRPSGELGKKEIYGPSGKFVRTMYDPKTGKPFLITPHQKDGEIIKVG